MARKNHSKTDGPNQNKPQHNTNIGQSQQQNSAKQPSQPNNKAQTKPNNNNNNTNTNNAHNNNNNATNNNKRAKLGKDHQDTELVQLTKPIKPTTAPTTINLQPQSSNNTIKRKTPPQQVATTSTDDDDDDDDDNNNTLVKPNAQKPINKALTPNQRTNTTNKSLSTHPIDRKVNSVAPTQSKKSWLDEPIAPLLTAAVSSSDDDDDDDDTDEDSSPGDEQDDDNDDTDEDSSPGDEQDDDNDDTGFIDENDVLDVEGEEEGEFDLGDFEGEIEFDEEFLRMLADGTDSDEDATDDDETDSDQDEAFELDTKFKQDLSKMSFEDTMKIITADLHQNKPPNAKLKKSQDDSAKHSKEDSDEGFEINTKFKKDLSTLPYDQILKIIQGDIAQTKNKKINTSMDNDDDDDEDDYDEDLFDGEGEFDFDSLDYEGEDFGEGDDTRMIFYDDSDEDDDDDDDEEEDQDDVSNTMQDSIPTNKKTSSSQKQAPLQPKTPQPRANPFIVEVNRKPEIHVSRLQLPVCAQETEIMEILNANDVTILSGETGSGKTTQVPQFLYEAGYCRDGLVGITQPRRVAAISAANRVQDELNTHPKRVVGYQIRFENNCTKDTVIKMMTEGVLLREIQTDFLLSRYTSIIIDEAHERGLNTDILLGLLSRIVPLRNQIVDICHQLIQHGLLPPPPPFNPSLPMLSQRQSQNLSENLSTSSNIDETSQKSFYNRLTPQNQQFFDAIITQCMSGVAAADEVIMGFTPKRLKHLPFDELAKQFALNGISKGKLKIIIMSATLRVTDFTQNYKLFPLPPPVYTVNSRQFPVDIHFSRITPIDYVEKSLQKVCRVHTRLPPGAILVFLTGREEIEAFCTKLRSVFPSPTPGEDNSVSLHNTGLGAGKLYLKALKLVKKSLMENKIVVDFGLEQNKNATFKSQDQKNPKIPLKAGTIHTQNQSAENTAFAKKQDLLEQQQRRWNLLNFEDIAEGKAVEQSTTQSEPTTTKSNKKNNKSKTADLTVEPTPSNATDTITPKMLKYLVNRQVVLIKEAEKKNKEFREYGRAKDKHTRGTAFSMEEIQHAEQGQTVMTIDEQEANGTQLHPVETVNVVTELVKYRQQQAKLAAIEAAKLKKEKQKASGTMADDNQSEDEDDDNGDDFDEDDEALYELSDDDDYDDDDDEDKKNAEDQLGSDNEGDKDDDEVEDVSQTVLEKEQSQSKQSQEKQKQRWEEELEQLKSSSPIPLLVLPLYAMLPTSEQMKVFQWEKYAHGARVVIVSTNMAETSVTIPNIKYVVDTGREKVKNVDIQTGATNFTIGFIPQSSAGQRAGRAGRTGPGHAYRLFSGAVFNDHFPLHSTPEILKQPFENTLLQMKSIGIHDITRFPFPTPPVYKTVRTAGYILYVLGALQTRQEKLYKLQQEHALLQAKEKKNTALLHSSKNSLLDNHSFLQQRRVDDSNDKPFLLQGQTKWQMLQQYQQQQQQYGQNGTDKKSSSQQLTAGMTKFQRRQYLKQQKEALEQEERLAQQKGLIDAALESIETVRIPTSGGQQYTSLLDMDITQLGETMAFFPLHPRFSKVILTCTNQQLGTLPYGIALTSVMTIQEIQIVPRFVQEYEMAAKKANEAKRLKKKNGKSANGDKNDDDDDDDQDIDSIDITEFDTDDDDDDGDTKMDVDDENKDNIGSEVNDDLAKLMKQKQEAKAKKIQKAKDALKEERRQLKAWLQERYNTYKAKCAQFLVPESDLFTKLNIFGAYLFTRQSAVRSAWKSYIKQQSQQFQEEHATGKLKPAVYQDLCWKYNIQPMVKEFRNDPSIAQRFDGIPQIVQTYQNLPPKSRNVVDKKLDTWCKEHYVRAKGLSDCYKLFKQIQQIVVGHLENKINVLLKGKRGDLLQSKGNKEQDSEFGIEDIMLGDQDDEEYEQVDLASSSEDGKTTSNKHQTNNRNVLISKLDPQARLKYDRMKLLLENLTTFTECIPPPQQTTYNMLQQIILASFADKIAWKMSDERKQDYIARHTLQKLALVTKPSPQALLQMGEPIRLLPRARNYSEQSRLKIMMLQQRFSRLPGGLSHPDYISQLNEVTKSIPLSMNDLTNAYEILESSEPIFISPTSTLYQTQHGFMNRIKDIRNQNDQQDSGKFGEQTISTQTLQQYALNRKLKGSLVSQVQQEMDSELKFVLFNEMVEDQGKYNMTFMNDCTLINEKWLPVICNQLCHIQQYLSTPPPFMTDNTDHVEENPDIESSKLTGAEKLAKAKHSTSKIATQSNQPSLTHPEKAELYRYSDIKYGHKAWKLQPYAVPYLPTVIATIGAQNNTNGLRLEDLTQNTGTLQQYHQHFAKSLLDGTIFPFIKPFIPNYVQPPSIVLEDKLREPALQFIQCLQHFNIYTVQDLYDVWYGKDGSDTKKSKNPTFLKQEFFMFITNKQHRLAFEKSWPPQKP